MKRARKPVPLKTKYECLKGIEGGKKRADLATKYEVAVNTISDWVRNKDKIVKDYLSGGQSSSMKYKRPSRHERVDKALFAWFVQARSNNVPLSGPILLEKANHFCSSLYGEGETVSPSWLNRWKVRYNIACRTVSGEDKSVQPEVECSWLETTLPTLLAKYNLKDVFNADEFGLFYAALPKTSLHLKGQRCSGGKYSKNRLTGLVCSNALGEKLPIFVIGKSHKPRCFKNIKSLPCEYKSQNKAWMDSILFTAWVKKIDGRMKSAGRNILLLVDNCPSHLPIPDLEAVNLFFLPKNTTSKLQPMDMGVIRSLKAYYRILLVQKMIECIDEGKPLPKISILDAMFMVTAAWKNVTVKTIVNCFRKAGISASAQEDAISDADDPFSALRSSLETLQERDGGLINGESTPETFVDFDHDVATDETATLSDQNIVDKFSGKVVVEDDDVDDDLIDLSCEPDMPIKPTKSEFSAALKTIETMSLFMDEDSKNKYLRCANELRNITDSSEKTVQLTIDNFFQAV